VRFIAMPPSWNARRDAAARRTLRGRKTLLAAGVFVLLSMWRLPLPTGARVA
jgi:hypothetical protein